MNLYYSYYHESLQVNWRKEKYNPSRRNIPSDEVSVDEYASDSDYGPDLSLIFIDIFSSTSYLVDKPAVR
jgi:hypothetical protein